MGSDLDVHTVTFDGNQFSEKGKHRDGRQLVPGSTAALSMGADNIGEYSYTYPADNVSIFTPCRIVFKIFQRRFFEKRHLSERISYFLFFRYYCACKKITLVVLYALRVIDSDGIASAASCIPHRVFVHCCLS